MSSEFLPIFRTCVTSAHCQVYIGKFSCYLTAHCCICKCRINFSIGLGCVCCFDLDWSLCNCQLFCVFQFTSILLTSRTNFNCCTIYYIDCCNLCRIFCPCSVRFLIFDLDSIKIFTEYRRCSCCMCFSIINFCHISRSQRDKVFNLLLFPISRECYRIAWHCKTFPTANSSSIIQSFNCPPCKLIAFTGRLFFYNNIRTFIMFFRCIR